MSELTRAEALDLAERLLAIRSLRAFVRRLWPVLHGRKKLVWSWHLDALCLHLEALTEGRIPHNRLAVAVPPGTSKSMLCSVLWPAWEWLRTPEQSYLCVANAAPLALRDAKRCRDVCASPAYRALQELAVAADFSALWEFERGQDAKGYFENTSHGFRISQSTGARVTGHRAGTIIVDDPLDTADVFPGSTKVRESVEYFTEVLSTRDEDEYSTRWLAIMQRQDSEDLIGHIKANEADQWTVLELPAEFDPERRCSTCLGWSDPRKVKGELLSPRMSSAVLDKRRKQLGSRYRAQYQQDPQPWQGKVFRAEWVRRFRFAELPALDWVVCSVDATLKDTRHSDLVSVQVWGGAGAKRFLLWSERGRWGLVETKAAVRRVVELFRSQLTAVLIERAHNGAAVIEELGRDVSGVIGVDQLGKGSSKIARAQSVAPQWEAGDVHVPWSDDRAPFGECWWVDDFTRELLSFPSSKRDDQVDAHCQALQWAAKRSGFWFEVIR